MRSFPPDVVVLDSDSLLHARLEKGKSGLRLARTKSYRLAGDTFVSAPVSPALASPDSLADALRRLRMDSGNWQKVSLLLPDAWFRMNIVDLPNLPQKESETIDVVRWNLKRTLPIPPDELRVSYSVLSRSERGGRVLVLSALDATLSAIEAAFAKASFEVILIEPVGLNLWNAIAVREAETNADRLFVYVRDTDFTTAVFRGAQPLFIRSRNLGLDRTIDQELRLSATYLRDSLSVAGFSSCWVAGRQDAAIRAALAEEFDTEVRPVRAGDFLEALPAGSDGSEAELIACTGVFTG
jgi:Tfp pilus assembly PilM family ATPase